MNAIRKLKENVTSFMTEIAEHYGKPSQKLYPVYGQSTSIACIRHCAGKQNLCLPSILMAAQTSCYTSAEKNCSLVTLSICIRNLNCRQ